MRRTLVVRGPLWGRMSNDSLCLPVPLRTASGVGEVNDESSEMCTLANLLWHRIGRFSDRQPAVILQTLIWWKRRIQQSRVLVGTFSEDNCLECAEKDVKVKCN